MTFNNGMSFDNSTLFDGLEISKEKELCEEYMGKFPVISITLKGATGALSELQISGCHLS